MKHRGKNRGKLTHTHTQFRCVCLVGDFLRIFLPWDSSPLNSPPFGEYVCNFFHFSEEANLRFRREIRKYFLFFGGRLKDGQGYNHDRSAFAMNSADFSEFYNRY